jgi:protein SCO1/2
LISKKSSPLLKEYVRHFDKDFIGVSGEQAQINQLIKPFGAYYADKHLDNVYR